MKKLNYMLFLFITLVISSCGVDLEFDLPQGLKGDQGIPGKDGQSAYELWVSNVNKGEYPEWINNTTEQNFFQFLTGAKGEDGDPISIEIGKNGNWFIGGKDSGVSAIGLKGEDGEQGETGKSGSVVTIVDGYWFIDGITTKIPAIGEKGETGIPGTEGKSAYRIWKDFIADGTVDDPRFDGDEIWPANYNSEYYFYLYLRGRDGKDGEDLDKPDAAYIDVTKQNIDIFYKGSGGAFTVKCNYKWTVKVLSEHSSVKVDTYLKITPTYGQTYTMPDGSTFTTTDGSIAWQSLAIPERDLTFEIRFETHNGDWRWVHESVFITIHAEGTKP